MNWLLKQLSTPSTHNALAAIAAALTPLVPPPYGLIAVSVFAALGIFVPEPGEKTMAVQSSSITRVLIPIALMIAASGYLVSCSTAQNTQLQSAACVGQSVANAVTASGASDPKLAAAGSLASATLGALCTGLATDTPLTVTPAPVNPLPTPAKAS